MPEERDQSFRVRMSSAERAMLEALAERDGVSASDVVRLLVRRAYSDAFPGGQPPRRTVRR